MLQARIVSPRGSLYFAAEATPYDLETLRSHVHDLQSPDTRDVRLELALDRGMDAAVSQRVSVMLEQLAKEGIQVSVSPERGARRAAAR
jgi:hypothetical protein